VVESGLPPAALTAVALHAGHVMDAAAEPAPAYWGVVFVARLAPAGASKAEVGGEVAEAWAASAWTAVAAGAYTRPLFGST